MEANLLWRFIRLCNHENNKPVFDSDREFKGVEAIEDNEETDLDEGTFLDATATNFGCG